MADKFHPTPTSFTYRGSLIPPLLYGTAEKSDPSVILSALKSGYRGLDCACQPQFYHEDVVGKAIAVGLRPVCEGGLGLARSSLFVQTKFTTPAGHTPDLAPYEHGDSPGAKVRKSLEMSLSKLGVEYVDALILHGPMPTEQQTLDIWIAMESHVGFKVRNLGVSNMSHEQLRIVYNYANIKPAIVQNRFWYHNRYDVDVRNFCADNTIVYQAFGVLVENPHLLDSALVGWLAMKTGASREDMLFVLVCSLGNGSSGISVLNGTTDRTRMHRSLETITTMGLVPEVLRRGFLEELDRSFRHLAKKQSGEHKNSE